MTDETKFLVVGTPLIEQDAEYLAELIRKQGMTVKLEDLGDSPLADVGRTWVVKVQPHHLSWAREIRSNEFPEPGVAKPDAKPFRERRWMRPAFMGLVGAMMGLRVGVKIRGGGIAALAVSAAAGLLAVAASIMFTARDNEPVKQASEEVAEETESKDDAS